jgi:hypothetical protein
MPKYQVYITETISATIEVEADDEQSAIDAAHQKIEDGEEFLAYEKEEAYAWLVEDDEK